MSVSVRVKNNNLYLDIIQNRVHHWEALHIKLSDEPTTRKEQLQLADMCRAKREMQLVTGEWNFKDGISGKKTLLQYLKEKSADKDKKKSAFWRVQKYLEEFKFGNVQLLAVTPQWIDAFQKYLLNDCGLSQDSARQYSSAIRSVLGTAVKERILSASPAISVKGIGKIETNKQTMTLEEIRQFAAVDVSKLSKVGQEAQKAFLFSCLTGLRLSDIKTLDWSDIESRQVNKYNKNPHWINKRQIKTKNFVEIPISQNAWELITPRGLAGNSVFPALARIKQDVSIRRYVSRIAAAAGIDWNVTFHTARRTFATLELENGVDPFTVQKLMGHKEIKMTALYAKTDRIKSGAVAALDNAIDEAEKTEKAKEA